MASLKWNRVIEFFVCGTAYDGIQVEVFKADKKPAVFASFSRWEDGHQISKKIGLRAREMKKIVEDLRKDKYQDTITVEDGRFLRIVRDFESDDLRILMERKWSEELVIPSAHLVEFGDVIEKLAIVMKLTHGRSNIRQTVITFVFTHLMAEPMAKLRDAIMEDIKANANMVVWKETNVHEKFKQLADKIIKEDYIRINDLARIIFGIAGKDYTDLFESERDGFAIFGDAHNYLLGDVIMSENGSAIQKLCSLF